MLPFRLDAPQSIDQGIDLLVGVVECQRCAHGAFHAHAAQNWLRAVVTSADSFVPLGPAADAVLLDEPTIEKAAVDLVQAG